MGWLERWRRSNREGRQAGVSAPERPAGRVRLVTYNVHGCVGLDGRRSAARIAEALAPFEPDIVALQEVDVQRARSEREDQPALIAEALRMTAHFAPSFTHDDERYGNALLSRWPMVVRRAGPLPMPAPSEPRGVLWATVEVDARPLHVLTTHLGLSRHERLAQALALVGPEWLGHPDLRGPAVLCGDFNALPWTAAYRVLASRLRDAPRRASRWAENTFPARFPAVRIDHIFVDASLQVESTRVLTTPLTRVASDHLPLMATLTLPP